MRYKKFMITLCCLWLSGCAGGMANNSAAVNPANPQAVYSATKVDFDPQENKTTISAPMIFAGDFVMNDAYSAFIDIKANGSKSGGVFFAARFTDWAYLDTAYSEGKKYPLKKINQEVETCSGGNCLLTEGVGLDLSMNQIRQLGKKNVFSVKLVGRAGYRVFNIPGAYFQGLLKKLEETKKS